MAKIANSHKIQLQQLCASINKNSGLLSSLLLNLSFFEHHGMLRLVDISRTRNFDERVLVHLFDEARHAVYLLKKANQIGQKNYSMNEAETKKSTVAFFNRLFVSAQKIMGFKVSSDMDWQQASSIYFLVVYAVELRAVELFKILSESAKNFDWSVNFDLLVDDEINHLNMIKSQLEHLKISSLDIEKLLKFESRFYGYYLASLEKAVLHGPEQQFA